MSSRRAAGLDRNLDRVQQQHTLIGFLIAHLTFSAGVARRDAACVRITRFHAGAEQTVVAVYVGVLADTIDTRVGRAFTTHHGRLVITIDAKPLVPEQHDRPFRAVVDKGAARPVVAHRVGRVVAFVGIADVGNRTTGELHAVVEERQRVQMAGRAVGVRGVECEEGRAVFVVLSLLAVLQPEARNVFFQAFLDEMERADLTEEQIAEFVEDVEYILSSIEDVEDYPTPRQDA